MNLISRRPLFQWFSCFGVALFLISGCSTMQPHLASNEIDALRSVPITIIYVQPDKQLNGYLAAPSTAAAAGVGFGFVGGFVGGLVAGEIDKKHYDEFMTKLDPYEGLIHKLKISNEVYSSTRNALSTISWLKSANWQTVSQSDDSDFFHEKTRIANTQVVIFISPQVGLRSDVGALSVSYDVNIYTKNPSDQYDIHRYDGGIVTDDKPVQFDNPSNTKSNDKTAEDNGEHRLSELFADNGALLTGTLARTLPEATARLGYYLTGEKSKGAVDGQSQ